MPYSEGSLNHKDYRHAWRRAVILSRFYEINENKELEEKYKQFALEASDRYLQEAPETLYGKPPLKIGDRVWKQMVEVELRRLVPEEFDKPRARPLACIYIGKCRQGRVYVGQTVGAPELRWLQHRIAGTGPFKDGDKYVKWMVLEEEVEPGKLNEQEAYYMAFTMRIWKATTKPPVTIGWPICAGKLSGSATRHPEHHGNRCALGPRRWRHLVATGGGRGLNALSVHACLT